MSTLQEIYGTPHNPFAWVPTEWKNESSDRILHYLNVSLSITNVTAFTLAIFFNSVFLYLIFCKTPKTLKPFSKILLVGCITDFIYAVNDEICMIVSKISKIYNTCF